MMTVQHLEELGKGVGRGSPLLLIIGGFMSGVMQQLILPLQFLTLVLGVIYGIYQIRLARRRLNEKLSDQRQPSLESVE